ncbi:oligosaccharide flippase family protein [Azospirillum canadense]|uniref:oligosaccharide flippase family protein n=1 Tax=Azospirillum canadense TaxID=403962 RepID=UPI0022271EDE|nr:oligosaccharide flippase family protein [Azospirillum canadense]MCW2240911.1 O-antigen/teichoic acid export membrane protein [Azospirillum canadense]
MSDSKLKQKVAIGAGWMIFLRLASRGVGIVSMLVMARLLLPDDFGLVALATTIAGAVEALGMIGLQLALIRENGVNRDLYDTAFTMTVIRGVLTGLIVAASAPVVASFFADDRLTAVLFVIAAGAALQGFENIGTVAFRKDLAFDREVVLFMTARVSTFLVTLVCALATHSHWALVAGISASRVVRVVMSYRMHPYRPRFTLIAWRRLINFSVWIWVASVAGFLRDQADAFVIGRCLGMTQVGVFRLGTEISSLTTSELVQPICRALLPGFSAMHNAGRNVSDSVVESFSAVCLLVLPAALGLSLVAAPLVHLALGPNWSEAVPVIRILGMFVIFHVASEIGAVALLTLGRPDVTAWIAVAATPMRLACLMVGIGTFGLAGGAWALGIGAGLEGIVFLFQMERHLPGVLPGIAASVGRTALASVAMTGALLIINGGPILAGTDAVASAALLFGNVGFGAVVFAIVLLALWLLAGRPAGPEATLIRAVRNRWTPRRVESPAP